MRPRFGSPASRGAFYQAYMHRGHARGLKMVMLPGTFEGSYEKELLTPMVEQVTRFIERMNHDAEMFLNGTALGPVPVSNMCAQEARGEAPLSAVRTT